MIHLVLFHQAPQPQPSMKIGLSIKSIPPPPPKAVYIYLRYILTKIWRHTVPYFVYEI